MIGNLQIRILGCPWHTNIMIWCIPISFSEITVCNFGIAWCSCALTLWWTCQVLHAHFLRIPSVMCTFYEKCCGKCVLNQLSGCIWYFGVVLNLDTTAKRLSDSVRKSKKALQYCWKAPHVWCSPMHIRCYRRSSSQLAQFAWQVYNWVVCFHANNPLKFTNLQCKDLYHCDKSFIYKPIFLKN